MRLRFRRDAGSPASARRKGTDVGWQTISAIVQSARGRPIATHQSKEQRETIDRVMHEFKHGELEASSGPNRRSQSGCAKRALQNTRARSKIGIREQGAKSAES